MAESAWFLGWFRFVEKIRQAGATEEKKAKTAKELGIDIDTLRRLKKLGVKETSDNKFYVEKH